MPETLLLISTGMAVGFLVGLTGVGGGALMTPVLILGFGISPVVAIATDLLFATTTKLATIPFHNRQGSIDWKAARRVWVGSIPGVALGVMLTLTFLQSSFAALSLVLAFVLVLTSASMFISRDFNLSRISSRVISFFGGGFIGLSVATTSVGAGALGMTIFRATIGGGVAKNLVGTDLAHSIPIALIAGGAYFSEGLVDIQLLALILLGSIPGSLVGSVQSAKLNHKLLRLVIGIILCVAAISLLARSLT